jgi:HD-like signal output (HDOD) protein
MPTPTATLPLRQPLPDLSQWTALFQAAEIPVLAETAEALELLRANEDAVDANSLGEMIATDPLLTLKVLAHTADVASRRTSGLLTDIETVTAALVLMGITPFFNTFGPQPTVEDRLADHPEALRGLHRVLTRAHRSARFALGFAIHRLDPDAAVLHSAALLHDFAEMLLWVHAPELALQLEANRLAHPHARSAALQRELLHIELSELEQALMKAWRLPELLTQMTNDKRANDPQVQSVNLAVRLARHTADGWDNEALPDDLSEISILLNLNPAHTLNLVQGFD